MTSELVISGMDTNERDCRPTNGKNETAFVFQQVEPFYGVSLQRVEKKKMRIEFELTIVKITQETFEKRWIYKSCTSNISAWLAKMLIAKGVGILPSALG